MSDNAKCSDCTFEYFSASVGGAIRIENSKLDCNITLCSFLFCSSTSSKSSSGRNDNPSGGALFIDVKSVLITQLYSSMCKANGFGHVLYVCCPNSEYSVLECLSDTYSGKEASPHSSIFACDHSNSKNSNINCTYPNNLLFSGALCINDQMEDATLSFFNVVFAENNADTALGLGSLVANNKIIVSHCNVLNCKLGNKKGIILIVDGEYEFDNLYIFESSGDLLNVDGIATLSFVDCWLDSDVVYETATINMFQTLSEKPFEDRTALFCRLNRLCATCDKKRKNYLPLFFVPLMLEIE